MNDLPVENPAQPADSVVIPGQRQKQPQQKVSSADKDGISDTDEEDEWIGGYWLRTPVVSKENYHDRSAASGREQSTVPKSFPTTVPGRTPKKLTMTHKECPDTLLMREIKPMDTYVPDGQETNLPGREHEQENPGKEDRQSSTDRQVEVVGEESQTSEQLENPYLSQLEETNGQEEQVQEERPSSPSPRNQPAEETHREVRRSARERRPRPRFNYETLGQPSLQTHVESMSSQSISPLPPFMPHMHSQFISPTAYTPHVFMPYTYYRPVATQVY